MEPAAPKPVVLLSKIFPPRERGGWGRAISGGIRLEYQVKQRLEQAGFLVVRSSGSHGPFDLIAILPRHCVLGIQVKRHQEGVTWQSPIAAFGCFLPVIIRRLAGGWRIET